MAEDEVDRVASSVCEYIKLDDRSSMRRKLEDAGIDLRRTYDDMRCGRKTPLRLAVESGALESATFLVSKVGKHAITDTGADGMSALQWGQKQLSVADAATKSKLAPIVTMMQSKL